MGGSSFDQIAQQIILQKEAMERLERENRELRRQIADLKEGRGIFVEIEGKRFSIPYTPNVSSTTTNDIQTTMNTDKVMQNENKPQARLAPSVNGTGENIAIKQKEVEHSTNAEQEKHPALEAEKQAPTFLEEVMLDEFSAALTSPVNTINQTDDQQQNLDEKQKERLRRELLGSYILE